MRRRDFLHSSLAGAVAAALPFHSLLAAAADNVAAVTGAGTAVAIEKAAIEELRKSLRGALLLSGDSGYDQARRVMNESIDKHPALIVQPTGVADIQNAVTFARERNLLLAVKCGGHSFSGKSTCDGGMQIDLSHFRNVRIDPESRTAYVAGGSLLGELDHEAMALGLVTTAGTVSHTGVSGLTLGGGYGRVARRFGLALDNVKSLDVVTADGRLLHASAAENPDLYWGLRGGGGNFGVVTAFEFALHRMERTVVGGDVIYPIDKARELLDFYIDYSLSAPDDLYVDAAVVAPPGGAPGICLINVCYSGPAGRADAVLAPLAKLGKPMANTIKPVDYVALQRSADETDPRVQGEYLKGGILDALKPELMKALMDGLEAEPGRTTMFFFQHAGGAISRVATDATAFPHRHGTHTLGTVISWALDADPSAHVQYLKRYWATIEPFTNGFYTNEVADHSQRVLDANYQGNLARLQRVKAKYDPTNLFRLNANVRPA
jgi:FAD/FMN-containing dehydrogenase